MPFVVDHSPITISISISISISIYDDVSLSETESQTHYADTVGLSAGGDDMDRRL